MRGWETDRAARRSRSMERMGQIARVAQKDTGRNSQLQQMGHMTAAWRLHVAEAQRHRVQQTSLMLKRCS